MKSISLTLKCTLSNLTRDFQVKIARQNSAEDYITVFSLPIQNTSVMLEGVNSEFTGKTFQAAQLTQSMVKNLSCVSCAA